MTVKTVEHISDDSMINRSIFFPYMEKSGHLNELNVFSSGKGISVIWRKYCCDYECVDRIGCEKQEKDRREKSDPNHAKYSEQFVPSEWRYVGSIECGAGQIRRIKGALGTILQVVHAPENGHGLWHAEIRLVENNNKNYTKAQIKEERNKIKIDLLNTFSELFKHACR